MSAKSVQPSMGCGYVVFVILLGGGLWLLGVAQHMHRVLGDWLNAAVVVPGLFGALLVMGAFSSLRLVRRLVAEAKAAAARRAQFPDQPWKWKKEWQGPAIEAKGGAGLVGLWLFTLFWGVVTAPAVWAFFTETHREPVMFVIFLFPLAGLGLFSAAVYQTIRWRKYGRARFVPSSLPGAIGGYLGGVIEVSARIIPEADAKLALRCVRRETRGSGKSRRTTENVLWEREERIPRAKWLSTAGGTRIPVLFYIPAGQGDTDDSDPNNAIVWRLAASAPTPGVDFAVQFDVPVFATGETAAPPVPGASLLEEYQPQSLDDAALAACGVRREAGLFRFSASHLPGARFTTLVIMTGFLALLAWYVQEGVHPMVWAITLCFGLVVALFAFDVWCDGYELRVEAADVVVTKRRPWGTTVTRVPRREITAVRSERAMSSGERQYYRLKLVRSDAGREVVFAKHIPGQGKAEAIGELVLKTVQGK